MGITKFFGTIVPLIFSASKITYRRTNGVSLSCGQSGRHALQLNSDFNFLPVNNRSVYISYGRTASNKRRQGLGLNIRRFAVNAARNTKMNLYQQTKNLNRLLVDPNNMPYSGIIMERLGAKLVNRRQVPRNIGKGSANNAIWFFYSSMGS